MKFNRLFTVTFILFLLGPGWGHNTVSAGEYRGETLSFLVPEGYEQTVTETDDIALLFQSPDSTIRVFSQELSRTLSAPTYIEYGNIQLKLGKAGFTVIEEYGGKTGKGAGLKIVGYQRPQLATAEDDRNYYLEVHVIKEKENKVITFWGKTTPGGYSSLNNDLRLAAESLEIITKEDIFTGGTRKEPQATPANPSSHISPHIRYSGKRLTFEIEPNKLVWGRFYPGVPFSTDYYNNMLRSEDSLEHKFEFIMTYCTFPTTSAFPREAVRKVYEDGRVLMLTLQPFTKDLGWIAVPEFVEGKHDAVIKRWALELKELGEPVFVRPLNEMNGDWDPWCAWFYGKDTDLYILAWRHIVDIFREAGADNVIFVWNPHDRSYPDFTWNNPHLYYPGDDYVDWVGLTGYNNGTSHPGDVWRGFDEIYRPLYDDYLRRYPEKPFMISEFSCNETGGDKAIWIYEGLASLAQNYPHIKIAVWFDGRDNKWLYELNSSERAFQMFKTCLNSNSFVKDAVTKAGGAW